MLRYIDIVTRNIEFTRFVPRGRNRIASYLVIFAIMCIVLTSESHPLPFRSRSAAKQKGYYFPNNSSNSIPRYPSDGGRSRYRNGFRRTAGDISEDVYPRLRSKTGKKRGIDVGIRVNIPTTKKPAEVSNLEKLENVLEKVLESKLVEEKLNATECPSCDEESIVPIKRTVKPAYNCDEWNSKHRICILERNIGDTVTFYLSTGKHGDEHKPNVTWKQEFHLRNSAQKKEFIVQPDNPPENVIIGRRGYELRISPITETDVEYNMYSATLQQPHSPSSRNKVFFMIRIVPIDLGFVYVGETIELDLGKFVSLPARSTSFKWYMEKEGERSTLPSNMRVSGSGRSIKISELRQEQEGILACSVYTDLDVLATKKRFLIRDLSKNKDILQSSPNHTLIFKEESIRDKRDPRRLFDLSRSSAKLVRHVRDSGLAEEVEKAMWDLTTPEQQTLIATTGSIDYNMEGNNQPGRDEEPPSAEDISFPEISESEDSVGELPKPKQINIDIESEPMQDEETGEEIPYTSQPTNADSPPQTNPPIDNVGTQRAELGNVPIVKNHGYQQENLHESEDFQRERGYQKELRPQSFQEGENSPLNREYQQELRPQSFQEGENSPLNREYQQKLRPQSFQEGENSQLYRGYQQRLPVRNFQEGKDSQLPNSLVPDNNNQRDNVDYRLPYSTKDQFFKDKPKAKDDVAEIVLNIGKVNKPRQIAEDWISRLISSCFGDYDCSETATCIKINSKQRGFCRCLPGSRGVGIFCREENQLSDNFDMEELPYQGYIQQR